jgi:hypothetical protein
VYGGRYDLPVERLVRLFRVTSSVTAVVLLVAFNLLPLAGVVWWDWNVNTLLILYWLENGIVGLLAVGRILRAEGPIETAGVRVRIGGAAATKAGLVPFFLMHYGIFWVVHGIFVFTLPIFLGIGSPTPGGPLFPELPEIHWDAILVAGIGLSISHGASFWLNYVGRREYLTTSPAAQAVAPYGRVVVLHLTIIFGAIASLLLGSPLGAVVVLVAVKTLIDLALHLREHRQAAGRAAAAAT